MEFLECRNSMMQAWHGLGRERLLLIVGMLSIHKRSQQREIFA